MKVQVSREFDWHKRLGNDLLFIFSLIILKEPNGQIEKYIDHMCKALSLVRGKLFQIRELNSPVTTLKEREKILIVPFLRFLDQKELPF